VRARAVLMYLCHQRECMYSCVLTRFLHTSSVCVCICLKLCATAGYVDRAIVYECCQNGHQAHVCEGARGVIVGALGCCN
jgi:hypothetical protein